MTKTLFALGQALTSPYPDGLAGHHSAAGDTEMEAARAATKTMPRACLDAYYRISMAKDGLTDEEGQNGQFSFPKRRCDLYHLGWVRDSGKRRLSCRGKPMIVWTAMF